MRRQDHRNWFAWRRRVLQNGLHRHLFIPQSSRNIGKDTWKINHHQTNIIGAHMLIHRDGRQGSQIARRNAENRPLRLARDIDQIRRNRGRRRPSAGASPYLVRTGKGRWTERKLGEPVQAFDNLAAFVDYLLDHG